MTFHPVPLLAALALAIALGLGTAAPAAAQTGETETQDEQAGYTSDELRSYVMAALEVQEIGSVYQPQLEAAATDKEQDEIRTQATTEMVDAIEDAGLTVERFNAISVSAQNDPELAGKLREYHDEMQ